MRHPRLPWKHEYGHDRAEVFIAQGHWLYARVRQLADGRWEWRVTICGATADGTGPSRSSAMRALRDRLRAVHQFLNAWESP